MAVKKILTFPEAGHVLKAVSQPARLDDLQLPALLQDLADTMLSLPQAVGLAAVQIGVLQRVFVLKKEYMREHLTPAYDQRTGPVLYFINAKIISTKGVISEGEGCLSLPGTGLRLARARVVKVRAYNEKGEQFYERFEGLAARAIQQEIDHLDGVLIIDREAT